MGVGVVHVAAGGVRLPDLDQLAAQRAAVAAEDAARDVDPLALRLTGVLPRQVVVERADRALAVGGAAQLGQRVGDDHERLLRRAERGPDVVGVEIRRIGVDWHRVSLAGRDGGGYSNLAGGCASSSGAPAPRTSLRAAFVAEKRRRVPNPKRAGVQLPSEACCRCSVVSRRAVRAGSWPARSPLLSSEFSSAAPSPTGCRTTASTTRLRRAPGPTRCSRGRAERAPARACSRSCGSRPTRARRPEPPRSRASFGA